MTDEGFGELLNTVDHLAVPCPRGHKNERMFVYETAVRWACGKVTQLPPLTDHGHPNQSGKPKRVKR